MGKAHDTFQELDMTLHRPAGNTFSLGSLIMVGDNLDKPISYNDLEKKQSKRHFVQTAQPRGFVLH